LNVRFARACLVLAALALPALGWAQRDAPVRVYRWVDANGNVHYGDRVPPEHASRDRNILNEQGVLVGFQEGEVTPEERAEKERRAAAEELERQRRAEIARRDRMLLETYLTVQDIEDLRDRRLELLESQIKVTELYLTNLRKRLATLQQEASAYKPYSSRADAPEIPENLQLDISRTLASINLYEETLARTRLDQENLRAAFDSDIARFKELKGG
jgi:hypothetical protein